MDLAPPNRFAMVEDGLYRSGYPVIRNFNFLRRLRLKTIVSVTPEEPTHDLREFCKSFDIASKHVAVERYKGDPHLLPTDINTLLGIALNSELYPMLVHCLDGRQVVGLLIMTLRKAQGWDAASTEAEYQRFVGGEVSHEERVFLADYSGGFALPEAIPRWLWGGTWTENGRPKKHPLLKVKYPQGAPRSALQPPGGDAQGPRADHRAVGDMHSSGSGGGVEDGAERVFCMDDVSPLQRSDGSGAQLTVFVPSMEAHALGVKTALLGEVQLKLKDRIGRSGAAHAGPTKRTNSTDSVLTLVK